MLSINRHIGFEKKQSDHAYWVARWKTKNGDFRQRRLAETDDHVDADGVTILSFEQALSAAAGVFARPEISSGSAEAKPFKTELSLIYSPVGDVYTVGHAIEELLEWKVLANAQSHAQVLYTLANHHLMPRIGVLAADEVNAQVARRLVQDILETPPRAKPGEGKVSIFRMDVETLRKRRRTANSAVSILRQALQMAWEDGKLESDRPWRVLRLTRLPYVARSIFLDSDEITSLLAQCPPELKRLVYGALYTGCRVGELLRMNVRDVGRQGYGVSILPGKTRKARFVFLCDEGMAFFLSLTNGRKPEDSVFIRDNGSLWSTKTYPPAIRRASERAGLDRRFCFHALRHTYASSLVQRGATLNTVADQLGHANTVHVMRTYGHLAPESRAEEVRKLAPSLSAENAQRATALADELKELRIKLNAQPYE